MKCGVCKYKNAALEAERHPNGTTVFVAEAKRRMTDGKVCDDHKNGARGTDIAIAHKALERAKQAGYVPLEHVWSKIVWAPRSERH